MDKPRHKMTSRPRFTAKMTARLMAGSFAAGVVSGIFGAGGGVLIIFLLGSMSGALFSDRREVFANATAAILPIAAVSALVYSSMTPPKVSDVIAVAAASLAGGTVGAVILGKTDPKLLKIIFAVLMIISGVVMIVGGK